MQILLHVQKKLLIIEIFYRKEAKLIKINTDAIGQSVAHTALNLDVGAIITPTESGHTAQMISKYRPKAPIIAVTSHEHVYQKISIAWGVYPQLGQRETTDDMLQIAIEESLKTDIVHMVI